MVDVWSHDDPTRPAFDRMLTGGGLSPQSRAAALTAMGSGAELDILVVGGGVVGAGAALDAASRGLSVGLVEARDWASGTSSRSSKLIHGGLRYLEMLDFGLVAEALRERALMLEALAPHLVRPVPFLYPLRHRGWERPYVGAGVLVYDLLARTRGGALPWHRHLSRRGALSQAPGLKPDALVGAVRYWDAVVDDARHTMTLVRTAAQHGALCAGRARVVDFARQGDRIVGAHVQDTERSLTYDVRARHVINATGVWTDDTQQLADVSVEFRVRPSKGVHLVVPRDRIRSETALILRTTSSVLFVVPWHQHWIIGTTDTDWSLSRSHPAASSRDVDYLLATVNEVLERPLSPADVQGVYAGLRPLLAGESEQTSKLSREHVVATPRPGLTVVAGGKYTTYRVMAADAVDAAVHGLGTGSGPVPPSVTASTPLVGAAGYRALCQRREDLANRYGVSLALVDHLLSRYGTLSIELLDLIAADRSLADPLPGSSEYVLAEALYAARAEGARHLDDVLARRTRLSIESWDRGVTAAPVVAELIAETLSWSARDIAREVGDYVRRVDAERDAQTRPDDQTADAARMAPYAGATD